MEDEMITEIPWDPLWNHASTHCYK